MFSWVTTVFANSVNINTNDKYFHWFRAFFMIQCTLKLGILPNRAALCNSHKGSCCLLQLIFHLAKWLGSSQWVYYLHLAGRAGGISISNQPQLGTLNITSRHTRPGWGPDSIKALAAWRQINIVCRIANIENGVFNTVHSSHCSVFQNVASASEGMMNMWKSHQWCLITVTVCFS